jgi:hypothetical protein
MLASCSAIRTRVAYGSVAVSVSELSATAGVGASVVLRSGGVKRTPSLQAERRPHTPNRAKYLSIIATTPAGIHHFDTANEPWSIFTGKSSSPADPGSRDTPAALASTSSQRADLRVPLKGVVGRSRHGLPATSR